MASGGYPPPPPPNPYGQRSPYLFGAFGAQQPPYRSQQPRFQRSPHPRFHQQYVPHHDGPSPRGDGFQPRPWSPRNPQWTPRRGSPSQGQFRGSPGSGNYRGRGGKSGERPDCNPGGTDDITQYYHPSMVDDPWAGLTPVPLQEHSNFTT